ncbi:MAG: hypothetical protein AUJ96_14635 [Armatimonadetes bacterium CG2_30_66_41]|nr:type II toxin-antitoxin system VapC family toxin [Armatimonadota bacterium]NCO89866.1 type II toxin-antitoxin system VapC family toxin [Armatimonadota bacterium]NCP34548.1 type II toxin-antitoxin system VapC family toxin [Armatimonadota bacterium]NCQ32002.1 type II toxin-antitoxin system VapC family toxin [Armatimonadota bacterium]OIP03424.1 MAG: hypothetical protein AUJ96_14635 [Armatimonadetes bacterium CG2_30_66_41]
MATPQTVVFDTNLFIRIFLAQSPEALRYRQRVRKRFREVRCAVVLHELLRGDKGRAAGQDYRPQSRARSLYLAAPAVVETPCLEDWQVAGYALQQLRLNVVSRRKMTNDALIAALCARKNFLLVSADNDFEKLARARSLRGLQWMTWEEFVRSVLKLRANAI